MPPLPVVIADLAAFARAFATWALLVVPLSMVTGSAVAAFLWALDRVTAIRFEHPWLLWLLPIAGGLIAWLFATVGGPADKGNNLIIDEIHEPGGGVPLRMAPLILLTTIMTHLVGGSAGREGTAVQMGGSIAGGLAKRLPWLGRDDVRTLLMCGVAAGFGGVFGTPVAGMVFALEVLAVGRMRYEAILPCLAASLTADWTCAAWGISHTHYHVAALGSSSAASGEPLLDAWLMAWAAVGGLAFGAASRLVSTAIHGVQHAFKRSIPSPILRPVIGGLIVIALVHSFGSNDYLGLGVTSPDPNAVTIGSAFEPAGAHVWSWAAKILFTAITIGSGFKGGEVTPIFFVGATLGNSIGTVGGVPVDFMASLGFVAVFAGAANTPLACIVMAVELFGGECIAYHAVACVVAYLVSGHGGIYKSQRVDTPKHRGSRQPSTRGDDHALANR
jgi:H+/Cl- antiporter ClcA